MSGISHEWTALVDEAAKHALSRVGAASLERLKGLGGDASAGWAVDPADARLRQDETFEAAQLLERRGLWEPLRDLEDPFSILDALGRLRVLSLAELRVLRGWLYAVDAWANSPKDPVTAPRLTQALTRLPDLTASVRIVDRILLPSGELNEKASPRLHEILKAIRAVRAEMEIALQRLLKKYDADGVLQESYTDERDGHFVLPVKISSQGKVPGNLWGTSVSQQTVFIEPAEVAALGQRLREKESELEQEIYRILEDATRQLQPETALIEGAVQVLAHWDSVRARASIARRYGGRKIAVQDDAVIHLEQAAHPLLWWTLPEESIVRNDVILSSGIRAFMITGPNTGGKTVLLKMIGLAAVCARTGFFFPGTTLRMGFFDRLFVDVGDHQSIEKSISSFSGHVLILKEILEGMTSRSLILLDELNTATDPVEGAALCRAFVEEVLARLGPILIATTHDPVLKSLALTEPRIENASMQFDETALRPTYRLVQGVPGRSRALDVASRLGFPPRVLEQARAYLSREHVEFERLIGRLEADVLEAERAKKHLVLLEKEAEVAKTRWIEKSKKEVSDEIQRVREKLRRTLGQAQEEVRAKVRRMQSSGGGGRVQEEVSEVRRGIGDVERQAVSGVLDAIREEVPELESEFAAVLDTGTGMGASAEKEITFEAGDVVKVPKWKSFGRIQSFADEKGRKAKVEMLAPGSGKGTGMVMTVSVEELKALSGEETNRLRGVLEPKLSTAQVKVSGAGPIVAVGRELDLRGKRFEEGMSELERYLDHAYRSGLLEVTVIHGLGTGALREGTRKLLSELPYIKEFRDGGAGHGGTGATVIEFDRS